MNRYTGSSKPVNRLPVIPHSVFTSTGSTTPPSSSRIHAMFSSFSRVFSVHVLYISSPPSSKHCHASLTISRCSRRHCSTFAGLHSAMAFGSLRNIPSPEHGTSVSTTSNRAFAFTKSRGYRFVTAHRGCPHFVMFSKSAIALALIGSLLTNELPLGSTAMAAVLFPPGAAHRSSILTGPVTHCRSTWLTNIDAASCT